MRLSLIPLVLLGIPLLEIAAFIIIGRQIGILPTLLMVFVTAIIGTALLRIQGFGLIQRIKHETDQGRLPGRELVHGVMILIAGVLLLTPGFVTDTLGFLLFVPAIRDIGWNLIRERIVLRGPFTRPGESAYSRDPRSDNKTIDLDDQDFSRSDESDSPWRDP